MVSAINPVGPSSQPQKYALAIADPGNGASGVATLVDYSGDTVVGTLTTSAAPTYLALDTSNGGYVLHAGTGVVEAFTASQSATASSDPTFITNKVTQTTLPAGSNPSAALALAAGAFYIVEPGTNHIGAFTSGTPPTIRQELAVAENPQYVVGSVGASRVYALSSGSDPGVSLGTATGIENNSTNAISNVITVGRNPIYGVVNSDSRRAFVINKGGDDSSGSNGTVSVINIQSNILDTTPRIEVGQNPIWADTAASINELAVLNQGNGTGNGSLSIINIPLCSTDTLSTNPTCDADNPVDADGFGTTLATIEVGKKPVMVAVLQDQGKAYVANGDGTISVIDMQRMVKTKDINVGGTLNWIAATGGSPTGKVYVTASDTQVMTIIRTDTDELDTTVPLQGYGVAVRVTGP